MVLVAAGRGVLDAAAGRMLVQLLEKRGIGARVVPCEAIAAANLPQLDLEGVRLIVLSYVGAESYSHARYVVRRLRRRFGGAIHAGFWTLPPEAAARRDPLAGTAADRVFTSLTEALDAILRFRAEPTGPAAGVPQAAE
jgi:hypothetical protein